MPLGGPQCTYDLCSVATCSPVHLHLLNHTSMCGPKLEQKAGLQTLSRGGERPFLKRSGRPFQKESPSWETALPCHLTFSPLPHKDQKPAAPFYVFFYFIVYCGFCTAHDSKHVNKIFLKPRWWDAQIKLIYPCAPPERWAYKGLLIPVNGSLIVLPWFRPEWGTAGCSSARVKLR